MAILMRDKQHIFGLPTDLATLQANIDTANAARLAADNAIIATAVTNAATAAAATAAVLASSLQKASNLSDLVSAPTARTNLEVYSTIEVDAAILAAKIALGTNYTVATVIERDALPNLNVKDTVMVTNAGTTGLWVLYGVSAIGTPNTFFEMSTKAEYLNAQSAAAVKAAYESNPNTNAFTNAEKVVVDFLTVTAAINLDNAVLTTGLVTDGTLAAPSNTTVASTQALVTYIANSVRLGGAVSITESLLVAGDSIVLTYAPKNGMVFNFATVRNIDANGISYDIPVTVDNTDVTGKTFTLSADTTGQFTTKTVLIQYQYIAA